MMEIEFYVMAAVRHHRMMVDHLVAGIGDGNNRNREK